MKFRLLGGNHTDRSGKSYEKGATIISASDLRLVFANKFELIEEGDVPDTPDEGGDEGGNEAGDGNEGGGNEPPVDPGDITSEFELAVKNGLKVIKKGSWYRILDAEGNQIGDKCRKAGIESALKNHIEG